MPLRSAALFLLFVGLLPISPAVAAPTDDLLTVAEAEKLNPDVPTYVEKLTVLIRQHGHACSAVSHVNAFSTGSGLRTVAACDDGTLRYELLFEGTAVTVSAAN